MRNDDACLSRWRQILCRQWACQWFGQRSGKWLGQRAGKRLGQWSGKWSGPGVPGVLIGVLGTVFFAWVPFPVSFSGFDPSVHGGAFPAPVFAKTPPPAPRPDSAPARARSHRPPPPAIRPRPEVLHGYRIAALRGAIDALADGRCDLARAWVRAESGAGLGTGGGGGAGHPILRDYIEQRILFSDCAALDDIARALDADHRQGGKNLALRRSAESVLARVNGGQNSAQSAAQIVAQVAAWMHRYPPLGAGATMLYIDALFRLGRDKEAIAHIRQTWHRYHFTRADERRFIKKYRRHWDMKDNVIRTDYLLWQGHLRAAGRALARVKGRARPALVARLALLRGDGDVDRKIQALDRQEQSGPGLVYARLAWRLRRNRDNVVPLFDQLPSKLAHPERWWSARRIVTHRLMGKKRYRDAYRIVSRHGLKKGRAFSEAQWLSGWIAFRFLDQPMIAYRHFGALNDRGDAVYRPRAAYWSGRACEKMVAVTAIGGCPGWYRKAAVFADTFYGQQARDRLRAIGQPVDGGGRDLMAHGVIDGGAIDGGVIDGGGRDAARADGNALPMASLVSVLTMLGYSVQAATLLDDMFAQSTNRAESAAVVAVAETHGFYHRAILFDRRHRQNYQTPSGYGYPDPFFIPAMSQIGMRARDRSLILAVVRNESAFRSNVKSGVGAAGLMQLMPATARAVSKRLKLPYTRQRLLDDPVYNLRLGSAYLKQMLKRYDGFLPLALAAYNAGPRQVDRWLHRIGDPRKPRGGSGANKMGKEARPPTAKLIVKTPGHSSGQPPADPPAQTHIADWIEQIPFAETRRYVRKILADRAVYRRRAG